MVLGGLLREVWVWLAGGLLLVWGWHNIVLLLWGCLLGFGGFWVGGFGWVGLQRRAGFGVGFGFLP